VNRRGTDAVYYAITAAALAGLAAVFADTLVRLLNVP